MLDRYLKYILISNETRKNKLIALIFLDRDNNLWASQIPGFFDHRYIFGGDQLIPLSDCCQSVLFISFHFLSNILGVHLVMTCLKTVVRRCSIK